MATTSQEIKCNCQEVRVSDGVTMRFPTVYQETVGQIKSGKYGDKMKYIMTNMNYVAVDATKKYIIVKSVDILRQCRP